MKVMPQILRQAENEQGAAESAETEAKRRKVSKRDYLDAAGAVVDSIVEATGARYTLLAPGGNHDFDMQFGEAGSAQTMFGVLGFHTKMGNVANSTLNGDPPGSPDDAAMALAEWFDGAKKGVWREPGKEGGFTRIDRDALAEAIVQVAEAAGKPADKAAVRQKLEDDPAFLRTARQVPAISTAYASIVGSATKSIDDVLGALT